MTVKSKIMTKMNTKIKIHAPAGNLECLKAAADSGADMVYFGFDTPSNLRNFKGINFSYTDAQNGVDYLHKSAKKALITVNNYPSKNEFEFCYEAIDMAYAIGADGVILSDLGLLEYGKIKYPQLRIYLSVQAGACNKEIIDFFESEFDIDCLILPRALCLDEITELAENTDVPLEVFAFGSLCINYEGRCHLSSYITGESTNTVGTCSTPRYLSFVQDKKDVIARICGKAIHKLSCNDANLTEGLPKAELSQWGNHFMINRRQLCKAQYRLSNNMDYQLNDFVYLNTLNILDKLISSGISALKIEGRQRNSAYIRDIVSVFRYAVDSYYNNAGLDDKDYYTDDSCCRQFPGIVPSVSCYLGK